MWAWYGTPKLFSSTSLIFVEHADGIYIGHAYQYSPTRSGFVVEALPETWQRAGFSDMSEEESRRYCTQVFAEYLDGHELISNRSLWFNVPMVSNQRWSHENIVLLGDAMRTGHPTIGSGTRLAMLDAEHLIKALKKHPEDLGAALSTYEQTRRPSSDAMVRAAVRSTAWYESAADRMHLDPVSLAYSYMLRTGKIGHERMRELDKDLVERYERLIGIAPDEATVAVIYHSGSGHTKRQAEHVLEGVRSVAGVNVHLIAVEEVERRWSDINDSDALILGSPTYMGSVSAEFKKFMELSSTWWARQRWRGKLAAGFTTSSNPSGDKLNTLMQMAIFAAQHGMLWVSLDLLGGNASRKGSEDNMNRIGGWLGAMAQAKTDSDPDSAPNDSDLRTAHHLGAHVAGLACQFARRKRPF
jgi:multimeric flavodoxin WrbA